MLLLFICLKSSLCRQGGKGFLIPASANEVIHLGLPGVTSSELESKTFGKDMLSNGETWLANNPGGLETKKDDQVLRTLDLHGVRGGCALNEASPMQSSGSLREKLSDGKLHQELRWLEVGTWAIPPTASGARSTRSYLSESHWTIAMWIKLPFHNLRRRRRLYSNDWPVAIGCLFFSFAVISSNNPASKTQEHDLSSSNPPAAVKPLVNIMSLLKAESYTPGERDFLARPEKEEVNGNEERAEISVAPTLTAEQETKLWRKIHLQLIPIIAVMQYWCEEPWIYSGSSLSAFIGNAKLEGLMTQLNLTGNKYNIALMMYFIPHCLFEIPSKWLPGIMRLASFLASRTTSQCGIQRAFSGFVTSLINSMNGYGGLEAWSWIFIMAGIATMLAGFIAALVMVDYPSTAKFLTAEERSFVIQKRGSGSTQDEDHHAAQQVWAAFTDWQVWALATILLSVGVPAIVILSFAHYSDKLKLRWPFIFVAQLIALTGYSINISDAPSHVKYFGLCLCLIGSSGSPGTVTWLANNLGGKYKRGVGIALQLAVVSLAGVISSMIFRIQDRPRYLLGNVLEIMFLGVGLVTVPITVLAYKHINAQRDREELINQQQGVRTDPKEGDKPMGDRAPSFRSQRAKNLHAETQSS
ncbi:MFS general substrate transporter [Gyrodon lividus]|nr:MFS general substrate transporter [Gyrodon lividus]